MFVAGLVTLQTMFVGVGPVGGTIHVPADSPTIQIAIVDAQPFDTIIVAPGTYHETINLLGKAITVRSSGGADVTTIDATGLGHSVVTCINREGPDTVLDGFTIIGGLGTDLGGGAGYAGGGMFNSGSSPTVTNCTFSGNSATYGGGMFNGFSTPLLIDCTFSGNTATGSGGAMYNESSTPTLTACTFSGNTATGDGGGMYNFFSSPLVTNCTFSGNTASSGGGMNNFFGSPSVTNCTFSANTANNGSGMYNYYSSPTVTDCAFSGNTATRDGGGMYNSGGGSPTVNNCTFGGNTATFGGGMFNSSGSPTVTHCKLSGNTAENGGGMFNSGSSPTVTHCKFNGNTVTFGGGMYNSSSYPMVTGCTFSGNTVTSGGGMYNSNSYPTVTNCTFSGNKGTVYGGGMYNAESSPTVTNCIFWDDNPQEILNRYGSTITLGFSDVLGGLPIGTIDGVGNINLDPMFVRPPDPGPDGTWDGVDDDYGDLRLQAGSPCINAGDPGFVAQPGETDLEGHARVLCERVDMGAYEFGIGDYNCDQEVNLFDFVSWGTCMLGPDNGPYGDWCAAFDGNLDLDVDLRDFAIFQNSIFGP
jgi:hypothetical protein